MAFQLILKCGEKGVLLGMGAKRVLKRGRRAVEAW